MRILVITEKPSVAMSIAKVLGAGNKKDGYYEGEKYVVGWCIGHLIQMAAPSAYDKRYAKWKLEELPIIPCEYKYEVSKATRKQFTILKTWMHKEDIKMVVNACDAGREGELIFRHVYEMSKCRKNVKRLWISSMEDSAIEKGFKNLKDETEYEDLYHSGLARSKADWLVGINMSRLYSLLYNQNYSIGRVQTPTLAMIVTREEEIKNFQKEKYYTVEIKSKDFTLSSERIDHLEEAQQLRKQIPKGITLDEVIRKIKITKPNKLYDLTTLQREANKYFGYHAKQTLDYLQSLYEKKMITYPRTDSQYLTEDMKDFVMKLLQTIENDFEIDIENYNSIFNSSKVSDHHAIVPTLNSLRSNLSEIPESEKKVYELIKRRLFMACSKNLIEEITKITYECNKVPFTASGKVVLQEGFHIYLKDFNLNQEKGNKLPTLKERDYFDVVNVDIREKYTQPKKAYTENTLLRAMELAGSEEIEKGVEIERKGLGTPATRAGIIENLISKELIQREKKNLIPTAKGICLINVVSDFLKSPKTTAIWEMKLFKIKKGEYSEEKFLKEIEKEIISHITRGKKADV